MARELLLHIGCHKTGTTTIQHTLKANAAALASQGCCFVAPKDATTLHPTIGPLEIGKTAQRGFHVCNAPLLQSLFDAAPENSVIASSENFSFFFQPEPIEHLATLLRKSFDRVRILVYLRRQDSHAVSHHQEGAKANRQAEAEIFGNGTTSLPWNGPGLDHYLDYNTRIGLWLDVFGKENVTVRVWDRKRLVQGDAWHDFINAAGLEPDSLKVSNDLNVSLGGTKAKIGHLMHRNNVPPDLRAMILRGLPDDARLMPSRAEARRFYERYRDGNIALHARLGADDGSDLFSDDFSSYPDEPNEYWTEKSANQTIDHLLAAMKDWHADTGATQLREAAVLAKQAGRIKLARRLIQAAERLRPHAPLIVKLRAELDAQSDL